MELRWRVYFPQEVKCIIDQVQVQYNKSGWCVTIILEDLLLYSNGSLCPFTTDSFPSFSVAIRSTWNISTMVDDALSSKSIQEKCFSFSFALVSGKTKHGRVYYFWEYHLEQQTLPDSSLSREWSKPRLIFMQLFLQEWVKTHIEVMGRKSELGQ